MNHPKPEEWAPYVFGETSPEARCQLDTHLQSCAECREEVASWRRSLRRLDAWKLASARPPGEVFAPFLKWAVAAALVLCLGFSLGRLTATGADLTQMRAALEPELRRQLRQDLAQMVREQTDRSAAATLTAASKQTEEAVAVVAATLETRRATELQALLAALEKVQTQRLTDYLTLKKDLDTIAVNTDAGLRQTEQELVELAVYKPATPLLSPQQ